MKHLIKLALIAIMTLVLTSCVKLKVDYPEINLYNLYPSETKIDIKEPLDCTIQIRDVQVPDYQNGNKIMINKNGKIKELYYNRWVADFDEVLSQYLYARFTRSGVFEGGVVSTSTIQKADYIIEARVIDCEAINIKKPGPDEFYVRLSMSFRVLKLLIGDEGFDEILVKQYESKITREEDDIDLIPKAYNEAMNEITEQVLKDMIPMIAEDITTHKIMMNR